MEDDGGVGPAFADALDVLMLDVDGLDMSTLLVMLDMSGDLSLQSVQQMSRRCDASGTVYLRVQCGRFPSTRAGDAVCRNVRAGI